MATNYTTHPNVLICLLQDVQYADIDHMDTQMDFTIDQVNFAGLPEYFEQLRDGGMRTIIILVGLWPEIC